MVEKQEEAVWVDDWLDKFAAALKLDLHDAQAVRLEFETGQTQGVSVMRGGEWRKYDDDDDAWGVVGISDALGLPSYAQALTIHLERGMFMVAEYRFVPLETMAERVLEYLATAQIGEVAHEQV